MSESFFLNVLHEGRVKIMRIGRKTRDALDALAAESARLQIDFQRQQKVRSFKRNKAHVMCQRRFWS